MLFQIGAGPEISFIHDPNAAGTTPVSSRRVSWTVDGLVNYELSRGLGLTAAYNLFLSGGRGIFIGTITDYASCELRHSISTSCTKNDTSGYSPNRILYTLISTHATTPRTTKYT